MKLRGLWRGRPQSSASRDSERPRNHLLGSSVRRGYAEDSPPSRRLRFFDPEFVTVLIAHRVLKVVGAQRRADPLEA